MTVTTHSELRRATPGTGRDGDRPTGPTLAPPGRRVRLPELAVGILVTIAFALAAVLWHLSGTTKTPVLAAATSIERGDVVEAGDLRVVYVASDDPIAHLPSARSAEVVGRTALVDLAPGALLAPSLIAEGAAVSDGEGVVGLSLEPGQYPGLDLTAGDRVHVVSGAEDPTGETLLVRGAMVFAVEDLTSDRKLVSLLMAETDAETVAAAAGSGGIRLVQVAP